ncbi:MAG: DNA primase [Gammaproteobacteria bacterium RIFCSPHIGHO2_12_FULL_42_10]|nr:MAG: DNA primase [Gammaproteobacteria bacterium RIFCSPHIGHO2_12_FULL_42_10]
MATIPRDFIELLVEKINIVDLIQTYLPLRKKSGSNYFACCPFHQEKSASFSVSEPKQFYYCFGCGAHGNAIDFVMQHHHLTFPEAIEMLAKLAGMSVPDQDPTLVKKEKRSSELSSLLAEVAAYYHATLTKSTKAMQYLRHRGITDTTQKQFLIGYAPPGWQQIVDRFGKTDADKQTLLEAGLIIKKEGGGYYDRFRDRIIFPIQNDRGKFIGFGGRIIDQGEPKYLNSPETPLFQKGHELYSLHVLRETAGTFDRLLLVEGYMDVIGLKENGIHYALATLGTATTPHHLKKLLRYTTHIVFCFDGDAAGRKAAERALSVILPLMQDHLQISFLFLPEGEDPDSLIRKEGKATFEARIAKASPLSHFFFQLIDETNHRNTMEERARYVAHARLALKPLPDGMLKDLLLDELSKRTRIDLATLKKDHITTTQQPAYKKTVLPFSKPMRLALTLLVQKPALAELVNTPLPTSSLPGWDFLTQLVKSIKQNISMTTGGLIESMRDHEASTLIAALAQETLVIPHHGFETEFSGALRQLLAKTQETVIQALLAKATQGELSEPEKQELATLITKKKS